MNGYEQYFKKRKTILKRNATRSLRQKSGALWLAILATALAGGSVWYLFFGGEQRASNILNRVSINVFGEADADDSATPPETKAVSTEGENSAETTTSAEAKKSTDGNSKAPTAATGPKTWTDEEITLFTKLDVRKKQLDDREASLNKLEEELQKQKEELDKKLTALTGVRGQIADKLEGKVKVDEAKIEALVSVYANMKPDQAAKIIEGLNDELAVEVLAKMKNKSAADILNKMDATRAEKISERYAGFREPAAAEAASGSEKDAAVH